MTRAKFENKKSTIRQANRLVLFIYYSITLLSCNATKIELHEKTIQRQSLPLHHNQVFIEDEVLKNELMFELDFCEANLLTTEEAERIENIEISAKESIRSLKGLEYFKNLKSLNIRISEPIEQNEIVDLSPLKELRELRTLYLSFNRISDLSPLVDLQLLENLSLSYNEITDISILAKLKRLKTLALSNNQIKDITSLKNLSQLKSLSLFNNKITDISPLKNLKNLRVLLIDGNELNVASALNELPIMKFIDVKCKNEISSALPLTYTETFNYYYIQIKKHLKYYLKDILWGCLIEDIMCTIEDYVPNINDSVFFKIIHTAYLHYHFSNPKDHNCYIHTKRTQKRHPMRRD